MSASFSKPFSDASASIADRFSTPFYGLLERVLPYGRKLREDLEKVRRFSRRLLREALDEMREEELGGREAQEGKGLLVRGLMEGGLRGPEEMADSCLNFLTAGRSHLHFTLSEGLKSGALGRDTTAQAMTWTLYLLLLHPSYLPRVYTEIDDLPPETANAELAAHLPLLEAGISEALRLHPPIPIEILENISAHPIPLPDTGDLVMPGEQILWSAWVMARLPGFWGKDAGAFRPERWGELERRPTAFEWPVFHAGPRSCLGQPLARMELVVGLVEVLRRYEFEVGWAVGREREREVGQGLTGVMVGGLPVRVRRRMPKEGRPLHSVS